MTRADVLALAGRLFPPPWIVGWNEYEGVCQLEVTYRKRKLMDRRRWTGSTWDEVLEAVGGPLAMRRLEPEPQAAGNEHLSRRGYDPQDGLHAGSEQWHGEGREK